MIVSMLYVPQGRAREYADLAVNLFRGCPHRCRYCFGPNSLHIDREVFHSRARPRSGVLKILEKDLQQCEPDLAGKRVLLCFTCDPYPAGIDETTPRLTRSAIELLHQYGHPVDILTKGGLRSMRDFDLFGKDDRYAATLTFLDDSYRVIIEPGAATVADRLIALKTAHDAGISTWASLEPVIWPRQTLQLIYETADYVDHYKVGKLNHNEPGSPSYITEAEGIDWEMFGIEAETLLQRLRKSYYIKDDLRRCMEA